MNVSVNFRTANQRFLRARAQFSFMAVLVVAISSALAAILVLNIAGIIQLNFASLQDMSEPDMDQPLYWVAPMDDNFRRDEAGLSPMGMALVPVYADPSDTGAGQDQAPGVIRINAAVENNISVRTAMVKRQTFSQEINTLAFVQYNQDKIMHFHSRVSGWVEKLHITFAGQQVAKGDALYQLYSPELIDAQEDLLKAISASNQSYLRSAEKRLTSLGVAQREIQAIKKSRQVKHSITVYAAHSGIVEKLNIRQGFYVQPKVTLMSIVSLQSVWLELEVFSQQAYLLKLGQQVSFVSDSYPDKQWQGKIDYIYPMLDNKTRTLKARVSLTNKTQLLKPNMYLDAVIHYQDEADSLTVPSEAVIRTGTVDRIVLALGGGQFKSVEVKLGRINSQQAEILEGLSEDDCVVTSAQFLLDSESNKAADLQRMLTPSMDAAGEGQ